jgi:hypothetical protein
MRPGISPLSRTRPNRLGDYPLTIHDAVLRQAIANSEVRKDRVSTHDEGWNTATNRMIRSSTRPTFKPTRTPAEITPYVE